MKLNSSTLTLLCIIIIMILIPFLWYVAEKHISIRNELNYIDSEIKRSSGKEKEIWISRRKKTKKRLLPFHR